VNTQLTVLKQPKARQRLVVVAVVVCVLVVLVAFLATGVSANAKEQGASSIRNTILDSAMQCAAIEGSFPTNLSYLESNYHLHINHDDYQVIYEALGSNVVPSVVVIPR
jgi:type II secretory pathway pseudopilin PulG